MAKKKSSTANTKAEAKASKKAKAAQKVERKEKKKVGKSKRPEDEDSDDDLESVLDKLRREWEAAHKVTEELVEGPPSRRANATLTPCPSGNYLWSIGGEFFSEDGRAYFYNDVFRYSPEKDEWRKFVSPNCPGPRSAHAVVASPAGGGKLWLFGGEFSSLHQTTFHHYRDLWSFDITTHTWERVDTKVRPSARSGHRMAMWKHYIVLFGGFYDPGITTRYQNDLWLFDTQEYKWKQLEGKEGERWPSPRSGFSFLPTPDGIILHGGYCKEYVKGKRPVGVMLEDTWFLKLAINTPSDPNSTPAPQTKTKTKEKEKDYAAITFKWEKRKKVGYAPSLRSGCTMGYWVSKGMGVMFGGVTDEDTSEEVLESVFWNDMYGYQVAGNGRWVSLSLKQPKKKVGQGRNKKKKQPGRPDPERDSEDEGSDTGKKVEELEVDPDDPNFTVPLPRYNAMLAVLRNTLYIYGGIYERGSREYTLDDFYALSLDKMDKFVCLKESGVVLPKEGEEVSSSSGSEDGSDDEDDEDEDGEEEEGEEDVVVEREGGVDGGDMDEEVMMEEVEVEEAEPSEAEKAALRSQATAFMGVSKDATRSPEDVLSTPLPGETLAIFYARSREFWTQKAHDTSDNRGKLLRRDGFTIASERYAEYKPILEEVERILAEAGLDEEEMRKGAAGAVGGSGAAGQSRNRR
ncbi:hypothetical protein JAAARDRAFT_198471 [Jaapia argillacea MUCL 33604]|uniref:DUF4110 domain-containing protein n=1 Tax=Jaapia argillacea MUCL 33604 TaxID=933084 RepID=A0A067PBK4_9AGAM|nr:hypothetical protein JAAARDRAFT_198471 [Jaapia argillacea MUCL 33604]